MESCCLCLLLLPVFGAATGLHGRNFIKNALGNNKRGSDYIIALSTAVSSIHCAIQCGKRTSCQTFFYNSLLGECSLHERDIQHLTLTSDPVSSGFVLVRIPALDPSSTTLPPSTTTTITTTTTTTTTTLRPCKGSEEGDDCEGGIIAGCTYTGSRKSLTIWEPMCVCKLQMRCRKWTYENARLRRKMIGYDVIADAEQYEHHDWQVLCRNRHE